jgi:hypothetical protein
MVWAILTGIVIFGGVWIYAISQWGFLLGLGFGWIPALIAAYIGGFLWPLVVGVVAIYILFIIGNR